MKIEDEGGFRQIIKLSVVCLLFIWSLHEAVYAQQMGALSMDIVTEQFEGAFPIVDSNQSATPILFDNSDFTGVVRAISDLQNDIKAVTGALPSLLTQQKKGDVQIIIGTIGKSQYIDKLISSKKLKVENIKGKWETFVIETLDKPRSGVKSALIIAGSDQRGTIYGIYELSRQLGVSPWYWWADVPPTLRKEAYVKLGQYISDEPKVKYRGIFINDEAPCFTGWSKAKFGGVNSQMYSHMFELLLRLRANYLWPAMWGNAFNEDDPDSPRLAAEYGIVMGTSHHEPMMRAQKEWTIHHNQYGNGEWNYQHNEEGLKQFWRDGMERNKDYENIVTMGMRGDGDLPMDDLGSAEDNFKLLERIMRDQRDIIEKVSGKPANETPQVWALYSEVLEYYDKGMKVPDDMMILLCDDNWGDVRRLPELGQKPHPGGYGVYYHVDLHGAPRAYQWLNMTQIPHMWEQLQLTYDYGVNKIWILNVGDLKPNEYPMDFFLQMAWNPESFTADNLYDYSRAFCLEKFGANQAVEAAEILNTYCKYNSRVSAEMFDQSTYNLQTGEFKQVRDEYMALEARALRQYYELDQRYHDAYMQLILHPVRAMANLYDMYYSLAMNLKLAAERDLRANYWADRVEITYKRDALLSADYNQNIAGGKWNHIMDQTHIGYTSWDEPREGNIMPKIKRIQPDEARKGGYVFTEKNQVVVIEAEHYYENTSAPNTEWTVIPDLGRTLSGVSLMPYDQITDGGGLIYKVNLDSPADSITLIMVLDSTLPFKESGHRVKAGFTGAAEKSWNFNHDLNWDNKYTKMYPAGAARVIETSTTLPLPKSENGIYLLNIAPLDPGVVFHKVVIDLGGYENTRLYMNESPNSRP